MIDIERRVLLRNGAWVFEEAVSSESNAIATLVSGSSPLEMFERLGAARGRDFEPFALFTVGEVLDLVLR